MKKITLLAICLFVAVVGANAQVALGIKGGLNFANVDFKDAVNNPNSKTGYHFGAFAEIGAGKIDIQPEILFSTKGAEDFDLSYLEIPILIKKNFAKILNVHLGPQFSMLTKAEETSVDVNGNSTTTDVKDSLKPSDISAVVGAGVNLPAGLAGGVRYVFGLSDISDGFGTEVKNKTLQVYLGWKFSGK